jgi:hypothetical protein
MAEPSVLNPFPPEFERFLYASVGEDQNGYVVTVLSTLSRLGFDPWKETAALVRLGRVSARERLETLLARFRDVPALALNHGRIAQDLSELLPDPPITGAMRQAASTVAGGHPGASGAIWAILAIVAALFQLIMFGGLGSGE